MDSILNSTSFLQSENSVFISPLNNNVVLILTILMIFPQHKVLEPVILEVMTVVLLGRKVQKVLEELTGVIPRL